MSRHRWTAAELDTLRRLYPVEPARIIAEQLGLPIKKVYSKAHTLGLNKPGEWMAERSRRLMEDPNHPGRRTWFKSGHEPHNKGKPHPARKIIARLRYGTPIPPELVAQCQAVVDQCKRAYRRMDVYEIRGVVKTQLIANAAEAAGLTESA